MFQISPGINLLTLSTIGIFLSIQNELKPWLESIGILVSTPEISKNNSSLLNQMTLSFKSKPSLFNIWSTFKIWIWTSGSRAPKGWFFVTQSNDSLISFQRFRLLEYPLHPLAFDQSSSFHQESNPLNQLWAPQKFQGIILLYSIKWLFLVFKRYSIFWSIPFTL